MAREWALTFQGRWSRAFGRMEAFQNKPSTKNDGYSTKRDTNVFKLENLKVI